ncbi:MAG: Nucleoside-diphosphate-sugar epimerase [Chloroflexi bacterium AL-W]|nr:Nucleoside-diphosphate-sugar epimerase [Chloroflexi bacterium AL-N1]NOK70730.1 Nucleoside-diphosphate-sugar epimerase [Chloroflexi bacterium AL-N10]NOK78290.1 Nucleoside-diphosphate-sugar epimerase [Chloroflexi bacterium AL-N5]NOK85633.1 Nucleoside-diphosphate-sugar epimerase [Chloroflexi bacterium AL-W]NOK92547.1 Nucleoside-diphosphate-sugar epimerase [Chloroflexi bacterium AL-N15]
MSDSQELHVIFGTGPVGMTLADLLLARDKRVRLVNRSGKGQVAAGAELVAGDATQPDVVRDLCRGAAVVYHCANVAYQDQVVVMPQMQKSILAGIAGSGAKLVVMDTLYSYGKTHGQVMTETTPFAATTRKGRMRAQLAQNYLKAHQAGIVSVTLARAADFYGPRVLNSVLGDRVFPQALAGKRIQLMGNVDLPHSYSYIGDVARTLMVIGAHEQAYGRAWHVPVTPRAMSQRTMTQLIARVLGKPVCMLVFPKLAIQTFGIFDPFMREFVEMFYQYQEAQIVDASAIAHTFGIEATPVEEAIRTTLHWYETQPAP